MKILKQSTENLNKKRKLVNHNDFSPEAVPIRTPIESINSKRDNYPIKNIENTVKKQNFYENNIKQTEGWGTSFEEGSRNIIIFNRKESYYRQFYWKKSSEKE